MLHPWTQIVHALSRVIPSDVDHEPRSYITALSTLLRSPSLAYLMRLNASCTADSVLYQLYGLSRGPSLTDFFEAFSASLSNQSGAYTGRRESMTSDRFIGARTSPPSALMSIPGPSLPLELPNRTLSSSSGHAQYRCSPSSDRDRTVNVSGSSRPAANSARESVPSTPFLTSRSSTQMPDSGPVAMATFAFG